MDVAIYEIIMIFGRWTPYLNNKFIRLWFHDCYKRLIILN